MKTFEANLGFVSSSLPLGIQMFRAATSRQSPRQDCV